MNIALSPEATADKARETYPKPYDQFEVVTLALGASGSSEGRELAFKMRALFNGETLVKDVAFDAGLGLQHYPQCTHRAD